MSTVNPTAARPLNLSSITAGDLATVKSASDRENIGGLGSRIWDKISDMFCGTDREQAKKYLFDLYSPSTPDSQKIKNFFSLQSLAGDGYKDRFQHSIENGKETYTLLLDGDEHGEGLVLSRKIIDCDWDAVAAVFRSDRGTENLPRQMAKDVTRGAYHIDGYFLADDPTLDDALRTEVRLHMLNVELDALECTPDEKKAILALANQGTFAVIMTLAQPTDPTDKAGDRSPQCPTREGQRTEYHVTREDGVIHLRAICAKDIAYEKDEEMLADLKQLIETTTNFYQSLEVSIDIAIDAQGSAEIKRLDYFACKGSHHQ
jgi:hypothetical protein